MKLLLVHPPLLAPVVLVEAEQAASRGWRVERHDGADLDVLTPPGAVAAAVTTLLGTGRG